MDTYYSKMIITFSFLVVVLKMMVWKIKYLHVNQKLCLDIPITSFFPDKKLRVISKFFSIITKCLYQCPLLPGSIVLIFWKLTPSKTFCVLINPVCALCTHWHKLANTHYLIHTLFSSCLDAAWFNVHEHVH